MLLDTAPRTASPVLQLSETGRSGFRSAVFDPSAHLCKCFDNKRSMSAPEDRSWSSGSRDEATIVWIIDIDVTADQLLPQLPSNQEGRRWDLRSLGDQYSDPCFQHQSNWCSKVITCTIRRPSGA